MSPLEERYRRLLTWLPEPARSRWADEMTDTFLQATTADDPEYAEFGSPSLADRLDVARLGLQLRLGAPGSSVRAVAAGRTVRLVALVGTVSLAVQALIAIGLTAWSHDVLPLLAAPDQPGPMSWGPREASWLVLHLLSVAVAVCLLRGLAAARALALCALALQLALPVTQPYPTVGLDWLPLIPLVVVLGAAALVPAEPLRPRPWWLLAVPAVTLASFAPATSPAEVVGWSMALADPLVHGAFGLAAALAVLAVRRPVGQRPADRGPAELAVAVLAAALALALASRWPYDPAAGYHQTVVAATLTASLTALVAGALGARAVRTFPLTAAADR